MLQSAHACVLDNPLITTRRMLSASAQTKKVVVVIEIAEIIVVNNPVVEQPDAPRDMDDHRETWTKMKILL
jgi:hypothetical protein